MSDKVRVRAARLTIRFGHGETAMTVKGQVVEGPDDGVDFLLHVQGDGSYLTRVLPHWQSAVNRKYKLRTEKDVLRIFRLGQQMVATR